VLIVEDDADIRGAIVDALGTCGIDSIEAANGRDALDRLRGPGARPRVILLDIMMPLMDGWQFRAAQRSDPALADIPVVVLTAVGDAEQHARDMDAAGALKKPVRLTDLLDTVERLLDRP
jgi:CheY-like chemotaxis protein